MKKVLVVSDNAELMRFFQSEVCRQKERISADFSYAYTVLNKEPSALVDIGAISVDMKSHDFVGYAISHYQLIISLHCKQIFPPLLVSNVECVNFHPGLNPHNRGWYPQVFSIINKNPIGATLHVMDSEVDHGEIVAQKKVCIFSEDTSLDVYRRVIEAEKEIIRDSIVALVDGFYKVVSPSSEGNYNSIADFKKLCQLDLTHTGTLGEHLDLLRALTHGEFKNAYFFDSDNRKIFVSVSLESCGSD